jgi:hypothetical protein
VIHPTAVVVRSYQVGFGDCFVLIVRYSDGTERHVLIDFGSTRLTRKRSRRTLRQLAEHIARESGGKLAAVVATHRHRDHISGFDAAGDIIEELDPDLVIQPWTEDPALEADAVEPSVTEGDLALVSSLSDIERFTEQVMKMTRPSRPGDAAQLSPAVHDQMRFLGETNLRNDAAVRTLIRLGENAAAGPIYARYGDTLPMDAALPGVHVRVLGPPTVAQWEAIRGQRSSDADEFWQLRQRFWETESNIGSGRPWAVGETCTPEPFLARWVIPRIRNIREDQMLSIVRALDTSLNNTSLILLIDVGPVRLLFPGDAQIESWLYALREGPDADKNLDLLANVNLYKVGHHGSLNATPKTLWKNFAYRSEDGSDPRRMWSVVSTKSKVHGRTSAGTEVPRHTLIRALESETNFHTTQDQRTFDAFFHDIELVTG